MTAVHATHLTGDDIATLGATGTGVCLCPTTERDLADGIGPARRLADAGVPLSLGSDSHAVVDLFEEARAVELDERLASQVRGHFSAGALLHAATGSGHAALGWRGAGRIAPGAHADLVAVRLDSPRTGGCGITPQAVVFAASAADVTDVVVGGQAVVADGQHLLIEDVGRSMQDAVAEVLT
jgi:cytosine/adenosine deaminase-related metal-dependent hydrolase